MKEVYLSKEIDNTDGYIDSIVDQIKAVDPSEELRMLITCIGGDTYQGDRIYRAISEHGGKTTAVIIGCAISMGASILPSFDEVLIDEGAEIMLHKAHIPSAGDDVSEEQQGIIDRFNEKTYKRMSEMGVDESFLAAVFLSDTDENYWLTPREAEALGLGNVIEADQNELKNQFAIAAKLDISLIKNKETMDLLKKPVPRIVNLADGRQAVFTSKNEELKKGDTLQLVGGGELSGEVKLENNLLATLSGTGEVTNMEEVPEEEVKNEVTDEMFAEAMEMVQSLIARIEAIESAMGESEAATEEAQEAEAKKEEEVEAKNKEADEMIAQAKEVLGEVVNVAENLKTSYKLDKVEDKREETFQATAQLDAATERAIQLKEFQNTIKETK